MALSDELNEDLKRMNRILKLGHGDYHPVEPAPAEEFERQILNTHSVTLLFAWINRLTAEIDKLNATIAGGEHPEDPPTGQPDHRH